MWQAIVDLVSAGLRYFSDITGSYGMGIILFTLVARIILVPLTVSQNRGMARMQQINPAMEEIKKKYKDDPQKMNEETVKLWREHGVNPMAGCLPMLIQLPIIFAMFTALRQFEFGTDAGFLWLPHLAEPDPLYILPVLAAISTFVQTKMSSAQAEGAAGGAMMTYGMPLFIGYISATFPAGLALYWTVTNLFGVIQQFVVNRLLQGEREREGDAA